MYLCIPITEPESNTTPIYFSNKTNITKMLLQNNIDEKQQNQFVSELREI